MWFIVVLLIPAFIVAAAGLLAGLASLLIVRLPKVQRTGTVSLILPLTGSADNLDKLLHAIEAQTLQPRRLLICLEGTSDPAYVRATQLATTARVPMEIVIGSHATQCAQKCSNQLAGLARIDAQDDVIVFLDADILPANWWLSAVATPILAGSADIVTGYRWAMLATRRSSINLTAKLAFHLTAAIDRSIALLPRLGTFQTTWGGTLALSPQALEKLGGLQVIARTLTEDLVIGSQATAHGLRILTRGALLVRTPTDNGLAAMCRFGRRQYQIVCLYQPKLWWLAFLSLSSRLAAWVIFILHIEHSWARLGGLALFCVALVAVLVQAVVARRLGMGDRLSVTMLQVTLVLVKPVVDFLHWALIVAAWNPRIVTWGHVSYRVDGPEKITVLKRAAWE